MGQIKLPKWARCSCQTHLEAVYVDAESLAYFVKYGSVSVIEHRGHAGNLDAAEAASLAEITHDLPINERRGYHDRAKEVILPITPELLELCREPFRSDCDFKAKFIFIRRTESGWRLVMRKRWDQEVILRPKFEFLSTRKVGEAPPKEQ